MSDILQRIESYKREEIAAAKSLRPWNEVVAEAHDAPPVRRFLSALVGLAAAGAIWGWKPRAPLAEDAPIPEPAFEVDAGGPDLGWCYITGADGVTRGPFKITGITGGDETLSFKTPAESKPVHLVPVTFTAGKKAGEFEYSIEIETDLATGGKAKSIVRGSVETGEEATAAR